MFAVIDKREKGTLEEFQGSRLNLNTLKITGMWPTALGLLLVAGSQIKSLEKKGHWKSSKESEKDLQPVF